ncbi:DUF432 domain-containing protein [Thermococcus sp.]
MRIFGEHGLRTQFIHVGEKKIHVVENSEGTFTYRRDNVRVKILGGMRLSILPAPAEGYGVRFLMVKLKETLAIPPGETVHGYLSAPVDVIVKAGDTIIDRFILGKEKYALYGEHSIGVITRYHLSGFYKDEPDSLGVIKLVVRNPTKDWRLVKRIVIPIRNSVMFYSEEKAYYPLVILTTKEPYEVNNTGNPPDGRLKATHETEPLPNFRMRWWP